MKKKSADKNVSPDIVVAGGGWAGLAAAVKLTSAGYKPRLIEASPTLGGRARSITIDNKQLDNGQHIFLGGYKNTLELLHLLQLRESDLFLRKPLKLTVRNQSNNFQIKAARLPSPFHMVFALAFAKGLNINDKWMISQCWLKMLACRFKLEPDITVLDYLTQHKQSDYIIKVFWEPLCLGALNTLTNLASMQVFLTVLQKSFTGSNRNSNILLAKKCLGDILPIPATNYIRSGNGIVTTNERLKNISIQDNAVHKIETNKNNLKVQHLILATPFQQTLSLLLSAHIETEVITQLQKYSQEPIVTLYLQYPAVIQIKDDMLGLTDTLTQWLIDRKSCGQPGLIAAIVSARGPHMNMDKTTLTQAIISEIKTQFPQWPDPEASYLIREKNATFACFNEINHQRPKSGNIGHNIWLAGDYLDTSLPATIEGAVSSGLECATKLIQAIEEY